MQTLRDDYAREAGLKLVGRDKIEGHPSEMVKTGEEKYERALRVLQKYAARLFDKKFRVDRLKLQERLYLEARLVSTCGVMIVLIVLLVSLLMQLYLEAHPPRWLALRNLYTERLHLDEALGITTPEGVQDFLREVSAASLTLQRGSSESAKEANEIFIRPE